MRISEEEYYLNVAKVISQRSTCLRRQYGAVIVNNKEIISTGYNGAPRGYPNCCDLNQCTRTAPHNTGDYSDCCSVHAEQNAIISASRREMLGATIYIYGSEEGQPIKTEPCPICARMIINAGIKEIITNDY